MRSLALFDLALGRFVSFEMVASGSRAGGTQYNCRDDDRVPGPLGIAPVHAPEGTKVAPANYCAY